MKWTLHRKVANQDGRMDNGDWLNYSVKVEGGGAMYVGFNRKESRFADTNDLPRLKKFCEGQAVMDAIREDARRTTFTLEVF